METLEHRVSSQAPPLHSTNGSAPRCDAARPAGAGWRLTGRPAASSPAVDVALAISFPGRSRAVARLWSAVISTDVLSAKPAYGKGGGAGISSPATFSR